MHMPFDSLIRLYIVSHKKVDVPSTDVLVPIRSDYKEGNNIGEKEDYSELRAHYWGWKNTGLSDVEYIGFFHYRRYLDFFGETKNRVPYRIDNTPDAKQYLARDLLKVFDNVDIITSIPEKSGISVRDRYEKSPGHRKTDLDLVCTIIQDLFPEYTGAVNLYLDGEYEYYGNMFVMRNSVFKAYCQWLFTIEEEFDRRVYNPLPRTNGYLGERLFGIWYTYQKVQADLTWKEVPRVHFSCYDDELHSFRIKRILNRIIPPGSFLRRYITRMYYARKPINK